MLHQDDRDAKFLPDVEDEPGHVLGLLQVHAGHWLVQQEQFRLHGQGPAQFHALLEAVGQQRHRVLPPLFDLQEVDDVLYDPPVLHLLTLGWPEPQGTGQPGPLHADVATQQQVLQHRHMRKEFDVLERTGNAQFGYPVWAATHDGLALPPDVALLRVVHLADAVEDRSLTGPVGTDDGVQLFGPDLKGHVGDGLDPLEPQADAVHLKQWFVLLGTVHESHRFRRL